MGRKRIDVKYNGILLHANVSGREIRVTRDVKKKQNTINYRLVDSTKPRYIFQSTDLNLIKKHYDKYLADLSDKIDIPASEITPTNKREIKIKWIQIFDRDEDILKYLFDFYDEQHFLETEEGEEPIPIEKLTDYDCQAAIHFDQLQQSRKTVKTTDKDNEPWIYGLCPKTNNEAFLFYNNKRMQATILKYFTQLLNDNNEINNQTKEELRENLHGAGLVLRDEISKDEYGTGLYVVDSVDDYYSNNIYKVKEGKLIVAQRQITPNFIINEFMKLLEKEPDMQWRVGRLFSLCVECT